jgi:hypothetical protein
MAQTLIDSVEEKNEVKSEEKKYSEDEVLNMLFKQVEKPKNYHKIKAINIYDNTYRINIWCEYDENNLTKRKIGYSWFAKIINNELIIK